MGGMPFTGSVRTGRLWLALVFILTLGPALPAAATERLIVSFDMDRHDRLIVDLTLDNGVEARGIIDTAATMTLISGRTAAEAGIVPVEIAPGQPEIVSVLGLGGPEEFPLIRLSSLSAGKVHLGAMRAALDVDPAVEGVQNIFPATALKGNVLDFDFERHHLSVYDSRPMGRKKDILCRTDLLEWQGLFFIPVSINGVPGRALIDTGSSISYINSTFADVSRTLTNEEKTKRLLGVTGEDYDVRIARISGLDIGEMELTRLDLLVSDPALFSHLGIAGEPVMVLGMDFLSHFRMQLDRRNQRFLLRRPKPGCLICSATGTRIDAS